MSDIVYNIITKENETSPLQPSSNKDFSFLFTGFTLTGYPAGRKPYVFYATMTEKKKESLRKNNITILKDKDDKKINFTWEGKNIVWHFDLYESEWESLNDKAEWLNGRVYFVKKDNDRDLITASNFEEKTKTFEKLQPINGQIQSQIINDSIKTLEKAYKKINELRESQSE